MGFSRQEYWSGSPFPPPGDFPDPGMEPVSLTSPALADRFFITSAIWEPKRGLWASAWWLSDEESTCHCRRRGFDSWSGKIPRTALEPKPVHLSRGAWERSQDTGACCLLLLSGGCEEGEYAAPLVS